MTRVGSTIGINAVWKILLAGLHIQHGQTVSVLLRVVTGHTSCAVTDLLQGFHQICRKQTWRFVLAVCLEEVARPETADV